MSQPVQVSDVSKGMRRTEGGLIVPQGEKKREAWAYEDWKKVRHAAKALEGRKVHTLYICAECNQPIEWVPDIYGTVGTCACTIREMVP